jgi:hypothetical protein
MRTYSASIIMYIAAVLLTITLAACITGCGGNHSSTQLVPAVDEATPGSQHQTSTSYSVSGYARKADYTGISGVTITFSTGGTATTNASGYYIKASVPAGSVTITPSKTGWTFTPASKTITVNGVKSGINFVGVNSVSISGKVRLADGTGLYGVTITFSGGAGTCTTNSQGNYSKTVTPGTYTITPSKTSWGFEPASKTVTATTSQSGINFIAEKTNWSHTWGTSGNEYTYGMALDAAGNSYVVGNASDSGVGAWDCLIAKYDANGTQVWRKTWGGSSEEALYDVAVGADGYIYTCGYTFSFGVVHSSALLLKYNSSGVLQWQRTWGGSNYEEGIGLCTDASSNVYVTGWTNNIVMERSMILLKYTSAGALTWQRCWDTTGYDDNGSDVLVSGGNIYVCGNTYGAVPSNGEILLMQYSPTGTLNWRKTWGGSGMESSSALVADSSGNIYVNGYSTSFGAGAEDTLLLKYNSSGVLQWRRIFGWATRDYTRDLAIDQYGYLYLSGYTVDAAEDEDVLVLRYTAAGAMSYKRGWGGALNEQGSCISLDAKRNVHIGGTAPRVKDPGNGLDYSSWTELYGGTLTTEGGSTTNGLGQEVTLTYTSISVSGTESTPAGITDTGGGGAMDTLAMKYSQ